MVDQILLYLSKIKQGLPILPVHIQILDPYEQETVKNLIKSFYTKYYNTSQQRNLILGINPGRNGAGETGIPFTDSKRLRANCFIDNPFRSYETSSEFVYRMIEAYGGVKEFYSNFFISSVSPIGFVKENKNYNYYDDTQFALNLTNYVKQQMSHLLDLPLSTNSVICLGEGKNFKYLWTWNEKFNWFKKIIPLPHPRYIMQYKRKQVDFYINKYLEVFKQLE